MSFFRDCWCVASYEVGEARRTRLLQLLVAAYLLGIGFADWALFQVLGQMEAALAEQMGVPSTETPGAMINTLRHNGTLVDLLEPLAGSTAAARALVEAPILGLWAGAAAMFLLPVVVTAATAASVAGEVRTRSLRFLLVRTSRLSIAVGKLAGQLFVVLLATLGGVLLSWVAGLVFMVGNPPLELAQVLVVRSAYGLLYALPYAGIGMAASLLVANPNTARVLAGAALLVSPAADHWLTRHSGPTPVGRLADLGTLFWPNHLWFAYWSDSPAQIAGAAVHGAVLGLGWFTLGFVFFQRRNL